MSDSPFQKLEFAPRDYFAETQLVDVFEREAPTELDLGCGDGGFLMEMAKQFPERNFLGVERLLGRVRKVCKKAERRGLENLRVLRLDSAYAVKWLLPKQAFSRVHVLFPDPWPKKKHARRRLVTADFARNVRDLLAPTGEFRFKTDHLPYFEEASEQIEESGVFQVADWDDSEFYATTDFEKQWTDEGKSINRLRLTLR